MIANETHQMHPSAVEIELEPLSDTAIGGRPLVATVLPLLGSVKVKLSVRVGAAETSVSDLLQLKQGGVLTLDRMVDQPLDVVIDGHVVARGVLVAVGEHFGVRITQTAFTASGSA
jgi:flagellar motor switch protein FliN